MLLQQLAEEGDFGFASLQLLRVLSAEIDDLLLKRFLVGSAPLAVCSVRRRESWRPTTWYVATAAYLWARRSWSLRFSVTFAPFVDAVGETGSSALVY